ncbi:nuclear transport factor 2 family protein [candidate division KSB1 bacterium]|nr:MAG: nuclear transport factor 2 family protein [candidate division KSB1 bacterium]MBC6949886.1 nuclear transport factor 2 family protein [candidate division KSB1 bacterium]MCE7944251.1 nuclear transport factor 2 family protein [Chlorobi bacterium CHB1]MDL1876885.1 nuclear transport factor 2 family protein [Cytophagia bacterium CHB2]
MIRKAFYWADAQVLCFWKNAMSGLGVAAFGVLLALLASVVVLGNDRDEATLRHLKEVLWPRAYAEQDVKLLDSILAPEFCRIDAAGNWSTKNDELEYISKNKPKYDSLVFSIKRLDVFENGTAIVAGEGTVKGQDEAGPYAMTYQSTNVLIKRNGAWTAISSHVSGVKRTPAQERGPSDDAGSRR